MKAYPEIYKMKLHEMIYIAGLSVTRVPGGWLYRTLDCVRHVTAVVFVPYDNEFMEESK